MIPTTTSVPRARRWSWKIIMLSVAAILLLTTLLWIGGLRDRVGSFGKASSSTPSSISGGNVGGSGGIVLRGDDSDGYELPPETSPPSPPASTNRKATNQKGGMPSPPPPRATAASPPPDSSVTKGVANKKAVVASRGGVVPYTAMIHALILDELGPDLTSAIYDPDYLEINIVLEALSTHIANFSSPAASSTSSSGSDGGEALRSTSPLHQHQQQPWAHPPEPPAATKESIPFVSPDHLYFEEQGFNYNHMMIKMPPTIPASMATIPMTLMTLKRAMSIGLGRLARDARLADNYHELSTSTTTSNNVLGLSSAFRRSLRTIIKGYGQYATSFLQIVIDGNGRLVELANWDKIHRAVVKKESEGGGGGGGGACTHFETCDPLLLLMGSMRITPPRWAIQEVLRNSNAPPSLALRSGGSGGGLDDSGTTQLIRSVMRNRAIIGTSIVHGLPIPDRLRPGSSRSHLGGGGNTKPSVSAAPPPSLMENLPMSFRKAMSHFGRFTKEELGQTLLGDETNSIPTNVHPLPVLTVDDASSTSVAAGTDEGSSQNTTTAPKATTQQDLSFALAIEVEQIWNRRLDVLDAIVRAATLPPSTSIAVELSRVLENSGRSFPANRGLFGLQYQDNLAFTGSAGIVNGRFWNTIRPTVGCASISKQCEEPDGCRYFCNMDYFLAADGFSTSPFSTTTRVSTATSNSRYSHQVIGFGSNNEYDWEVSLVDAFNRADKAFAAGGGGEGDSAASTTSIRNGIGRVTVFDCTVRSWTPPKHLTDAAIGFGHGTYCLNNVVHHQPPGRQVSGGAPSTISFPFLKRSLSVEWESNPLHIKRYTPPEGSSVATPSGSTASTKADVVVAEGGGGAVVVEGSGGGGTKVSPPFYNPNVFDEVSILKLDVEGFEHRTLPNWLTSELSDLGRTRLSKSSSQPSSSSTGGDSTSSSSSTTTTNNGLITFDVDAPNTFTISHYGMELHRLGHKANYAAGYTGALRTHYTLMQLYALGFTMFGQEKNPTDYCCFEIGMVHYRHYVRSETWHVQKA